MEVYSSGSPAEISEISRKQNLQHNPKPQSFKIPAQTDAPVDVSRVWKERKTQCEPTPGLGRAGVWSLAVVI